MRCRCGLQDLSAPATVKARAACGWSRPRIFERLRPSSSRTRFGQRACESRSGSCSGPRSLLTADACRHHDAPFGSNSKGPAKPALRRIFGAIRRNGAAAIHDFPGGPLQTIPDRQGRSVPIIGYRAFHKLLGGALRQTSVFPGSRSLLPAGASVPGWTATLAATGFTLGYFLAGMLGLGLLLQPSGVAVFWPAAGLAAGILTISDRRIYPGLLIGVVVGTVAANMLSDRSLLTALLKGFCNAGEALLVASLLKRWFGRAFAFCDLSRIAGFLAVAGLAVATSGIGGAATMTSLHIPAPFFEVWCEWFLSDGLG